MTQRNYRGLQITREGGCAFAAIHNPPLNLLTAELAAELAAFAEEAAAAPDLRALVLRSDNPDFFIAHFDVEAILRLTPERAAAAAAAQQSSDFHSMCEIFRTMPKATIAEINGRVGGGGSELALSCDMRFGALGRTVISQPEVALGILPGGGGTQRLPRLLGRGRALEIILGCADLDAATAERWGYLNRALPPAELRPFVARLAKRIAAFPAAAIAEAKAAALAADAGVGEGLRAEWQGFLRLLQKPEAHARMRAFLQHGGQTRAGELQLEELCAQLQNGAKE